MNKLKELWGKNRVLIVLIFILITCIITISIVTVSYFFGGSSSVYGNRLQDVSNYPVTEEIKNSIEEKLKEKDLVEKITINVKVRTIYINVTYKGDTSLLDAQNNCSSALQVIPEKYLNYYDISFIIKTPAGEKTEGYTHIGAKNSTSSNLVWDNNTPVEKDEQNEK